MVQVIPVEDRPLLTPASTVATMDVPNAGVGHMKQYRFDNVPDLLTGNDTSCSVAFWEAIPQYVVAPDVTVLAQENPIGLSVEPAGANTVPDPVLCKKYPLVPYDPPIWYPFVELTPSADSGPVKVVAPPTPNVSATKALPIETVWPLKLAPLVTVSAPTFRTGSVMGIIPAVRAQNDGIAAPDVQLPNTVNAGWASSCAFKLQRTVQGDPDIVNSDVGMDRLTEATVPVVFKNMM